MTRIGSKKIKIPSGVEVQTKDNHVIVKGPKGSLEIDLDSRIIFKQNNSEEISLAVKKPNEKKSREVWGLFRVLLNNMVIGVSEGFSKQLEINGVGYKASISGRKLVLNVGYSHPVELDFPPNIEIKVEKNIITVSGIDKQQVGQFAAQIREVRKPEPYKGKGIKYIDERIRRKAGKVVKTAGAA